MLGRIVESVTEVEAGDLQLASNIDNGYFLRELSDEQLGLTLGKGVGSLGKQFKHVGRIQLCYVEAVKTKRMSFFKRLGDAQLEKSKGKLLEFLERAEAEMFEALGKFTDEELESMRIDWRGKAHLPKRELYSMYDHIDDLVLHEVLHEGELIVYLRSLKLPFPPSWQLWGSLKKQTQEIRTF